MTWTLYGHGALPWAEVTKLLDGCQCAWADYAGFHVGDCPSEVPPYSHLWAWDQAGERMWRVRIDGDNGIVGLLTETQMDDDSSARTVDVRVGAGIGWGADDQVGSAATALAEREITTYEVLVPLPATFVRMS